MGTGSCHITCENKSVEENISAKVGEKNEMAQEKQYYAFISYKREDEKWTKWLQEKLEQYMFPTNLNGRNDLPKHIRPIFRDVTYLKPGVLADGIEMEKYIME